MTHTVRITVDLPLAVHRQAKEIAERRGISLSAVVAELAARGLIQLGEPVAIGAGVAELTMLVMPFGPVPPQRR